MTNVAYDIVGWHHKVVSEAVAEEEGDQSQIGDVDLCLCDVHMYMNVKCVSLEMMVNGVSV